MKNALVLQDHFGDDGSATEGKLLLGITTKRFEALEKQGLVREATPEEVKAGDQHAFEKDTSEDAGEMRLHLSIDSAAVQEIVDAAKLEIDRIEGLRVGESQRADDAEKALAELREATDAARAEAESSLAAEVKRVAEFEQALVEAHEGNGQMQKDLDAAKAEAEQLRVDLAAALEKGEKQAPPPANKKAADPANKGA